ncbi:MAG: hypothetical protein WEA56_06645 [Balneolaceae bacterium]
MYLTYRLLGFKYVKGGSDFVVDELQNEAELELEKAKREIEEMILK